MMVEVMLTVYDDNGQPMVRTVRSSTVIYAETMALTVQKAERRLATLTGEAQSEVADQVIEVVDALEKGRGG